MLAIFKPDCKQDKYKHKSTGKNPANALSTAESFICVLQIPEDFIHGKLSNWSQRCHGANNTQAKIQSNVSLVFKWFLHVLDYMYLHLYAQQAAYK